MKNQKGEMPHNLCRRKGESDMTRIKIRGMSCGHCVAAVTKALEEIEGIRGVSVDLEKGEATFDEVRPVPRDVLREKIEKAGYEID